MKRYLANKLLKHLFNAVTEDDVLRFDGAHLVLRGNKLSETQVAELRSGAEAIRQLEVWTLLVADMQHQANLMIFNKSKTGDDLLFGKACLHTLDVIQKTIKRIATIK